MAVFTIFFCGTGSNSFDFRFGGSGSPYHSGELVSTLARNASGMEFVDWIVVDGPASGNLQEDEKFVKPGNYSTRAGNAWGRGWEENVGHALAMIRGDASWSRKRLTALGYEVLQREKAKAEAAAEEGAADELPDPLPDIQFERMITQQALQMQKIKIFRKDKPITQINVVGWSRGAVTTHMLANALATDDELKHIPVNIVAVDPVPGPFNFQLNRTSIPSNVKHYVAFYAQDERSAGFEPVIPTFADSVEVVIYPMPGRHATLVGNAGNYIGSASGEQTFFAPGRVVRMLTENYLTTWGTELNNRIPYSEGEMLGHYDEMVGQNGEFVKLRETTYSVRRKRDDRSVAVGQSWFNQNFKSVDALKPDECFVNWHHRHLFSERFPSLYEHIAGDGALDEADADEVKRVAEVIPSTWNALTHLFDDKGGEKARRK